VFVKLLGREERRGWRRGDILRDSTEILGFGRHLDNAWDCSSE